MVEESEVPIPDDSGSSGDQKSATTTGQILPARPQRGLPVVDALEGLAASTAKRLGEFGSAMLAATARQLADDNQDLKDENRRMQELLESLRNDRESERIKNAVLTERIESDGRNRHLRNLGITVGTGLASTGIILLRTTDDNSAWGLVVTGSLLLLAAWLAPTKRKGS